MLIFDVLVFIVTIIVFLIAFVKWKFLYWRNRQVPYIQPYFPFGTLGSPFNRKQNNVILFQKQYHYFKSLGCKYGGLYSSLRPGLLLVDPDVIRNVMSKDFQYFTDRGVYNNEKDDPLSANLFSLEGQRWRNLRANLTPTFTTGKIKAMFPTLVACGDPLYTAVTELNEKNLPLDIKDILARFTTDVIGSCVFGLECNSFQESDSDIQVYTKMVFLRLSKLQALKLLFASAYPSLARRLKIEITSKETKDFFLNVIKETVQYRKENNITRNDFMQLLIALTNENSKSNGLTIEQVAAQAFIFFLAGFETSTTTMTFCLYELAVNQGIQNKVRNEIHTILKKYNGNITYDAIMEMKYLNSVIDETLRKYPPLGLLTRVCIQDYQIPDTNTIIEQGTRIFIPVYGLHHDPEYYTDPEKFEPERFNDKNKPNINSFTYMPFGEGPRICIGLRFGFLQTKVGLVILLKNFKLLLNAKTKSPLEFDRSSFILSTDGGVWLDTEKIVNEKT